MEERRFSHTGTEGGLSLSPDCFPSLCLPFFLQPAVCRQTGDYLLWFTYTCSNYCTLVLEKWWMCISLLCKVVNVSDVSNHTGREKHERHFKRQFKSSVCQTDSCPPWCEVNKAQWSTGFYPWGSIKVDCLLDYDLTVLYWATKILSLLTQLQLCPALTCHVR